MTEEVGFREGAFPVDVCIVGGGGHVGLPLGIAFAAKRLKVEIYDVDERVLKTIASGSMPFIEYGAQPLLEAVLNETLFLSSDPTSVARARIVILAVGTPVDEYMNPKLRALLELVETLRTYITPAQTVVIRSTVYPRTSRRVLETLEKGRSGAWHVAYCPERIAQGYAIRELELLPQIVSGLSSRAVRDAAELFSLVAPRVIEVPVEEAELAKLFSNAWRYIQFATTNQFYMIAQELGADYNRVRKAMTEGYGRAANLPTAGFAAGPCLLKDTMQLAAFNNNNFMLGHAAMMINEGLPGFLVDQLSRRHNLSRTRVGILGMTFKADIDDIRDSLSYKLGKILRFHGADVFYSDEYAHDPTFVTKEELVASCDVVVVAVPHHSYRELLVPPEVDVVDVWEVLPLRPTSQAEQLSAASTVAAITR